MKGFFCKQTVKHLHTCCRTSSQSMQPLSKCSSCWGRLSRHVHRWLWHIRRLGEQPTDERQQALISTAIFMISAVFINICPVYNPPNLPPSVSNLLTLCIFQLRVLTILLTRPPPVSTITKSYSLTVSSIHVFYTDPPSPSPSVSNLHTLSASSIHGSTIPPNPSLRNFQSAHSLHLPSTCLQSS